MPPTNLLGTGAIPSDVETWLAARGAVYACYVTTPAGAKVLQWSKRPMVAALTDAAQQTLAESRATVRRAERRSCTEHTPGVVVASIS